MTVKTDLKPLSWGLAILLVSGFCLTECQAQSFFPPKKSNDIHGFVRTEYRSRWYDGNVDQDLYQYWDLEAEELVPGMARGALSLRLNNDIDGRTGFAPGRGIYIYDLEPFYSLDDARSEEYADIYTGYVDLFSGKPEDGYLRVGRQYLDEFDYIHADALKLSVPLASFVRFSAFVGQPVSFYSGHDGDFAGGFAFEVNQFDRGRWLFEFHRYEDDIDGNNNFAAETWQDLWPGGNLHARFRGIDGKARDLRLNFSQYIMPLDLTLYLDYNRLFTELEDLSRQDSPLYRSGLLEQHPYNYFGIRFDKALPCDFSLSGGFDLQDISEEDVDFGNRDYKHADLTLSWYPTDKWFTSISGEWWDTEYESSFFGCSGEVGFRPVRAVDWSVGSTYGSYVFRYPDERWGGFYEDSPFIRTYYTSLRWKVSKTSDLRMNFEIEDDDESENYYTLRMSWGQTF